MEYLHKHGGISWKTCFHPKAISFLPQIKAIAHMPKCLQIYQPTIYTLDLPKEVPNYVICDLRSIFTHWGWLILVCGTCFPPVSHPSEPSKSCCLDSGVTVTNNYKHLAVQLPSLKQTSFIERTSKVLFVVQRKKTAGLHDFLSILSWVNYHWNRHSPGMHDTNYFFGGGGQVELTMDDD